MKLYQRMAQLQNAVQNCIKSGNREWEQKHREAIHELVKEHMPSGSGFDNGTEWGESDKDVLIFFTSFHHMDEDGYYDGWTNHTIRVKPSLAFDTTLTVSGPDRNDIKDYIVQVFSAVLDREVE